jgi:ABC-type transport system involved in multi-copper enzyme maturation permease subunit
MREVLRRTVRERWRYLLVGALLIGFGALAVAAGGPAGTAFAGSSLMVVLFSSGIVSRDARSGTLQMLLARPIRRSDYLLGRYLGVLTLEACFLAAAFLIAWATGALSHHAVPVRETLLSGAGYFLQSSLYAALILCFSTFVAGYGDVLTYVLLWVLMGAGIQIGRALELPRLRTVFEFLKNQILPEPGWAKILSAQKWLAPEAGAWALAVAGFLALAALIFSRRQFSYASE